MLTPSLSQVYPLTMKNEFNVAVSDIELEIIVEGLRNRAVRAVRLLELYDWLQPPLAQVKLVDVDGRPISMQGVADVFETDRSHYRASPMPLLGTVTLDSSVDSLVLDSNQYPKSVQVRIRVPGYGMDYISVELNRRHTWTLRLGPPTEVSGIVLDQTGITIAHPKNGKTLSQPSTHKSTNRRIHARRIATRS